MLILIALVMLMAGSGRKGLRVGENIVLVIAGCMLVAAIFVLVVDRTL